MAYPKFNEGKYKKTFDNMMGAGSFNTGMTQAREVGRSKAQAEYEKYAYNERLKAAETAAKEAEEAAKNKTYDDALSYWKKNKDKIREQGAARNAENIRNDPRLQEQIEAEGYKVDDYIDAMYAAVSDGEVRSEREYKQFADGLKKDVKKKKEDPLSYLKDVKDKPKEKKDDEGLFGNVFSKIKKAELGAFDKLKKSEVGRAAKAAEDFFNPFDKVKGKDAVSQYLNHTPSKTTQELARGSNRFIDSASLGALSNLDKKVNKREPYYNSQRSFGEGGGTDMLTSGLGYLLPGLGAVKAARGAGLGVKAGSTGAKKFVQLAREGAATGAGMSAAEVGIREALNGDETDYKDNLKYIGLSTAAGAVADPILHGLGDFASTQVGKLAKGDVPTYTGKPSNNILDQLKPSQLSNAGRNSDTFYDDLQRQLQVSNNVTPARQVAATGENALNKFEAITPGGREPKLIDINTLPDFSKNNDGVIPDTRTHIVSKTSPQSTTLKDKLNKATIKTVDNLAQLKQFDNVVEQVTGKPLKPSESSYTLGLNSRGSDQISKQILTQNVVDIEGNAIGQSLKSVAKKIPKGKELDFEDYLINKHAITRMERGQKVFPDEMKMSPEKSATIVQNYEVKNPEFKQLANEYYEYNKQLGKAWLVDTGLIAPEQWDAYLELNPNYVPNKRFFSDIEKPGLGGIAKKAFANQSNPIKKTTGSQRPIVSPIESTIENTAYYVKTAKRNEVMQSLINNLQKDPEAFKGWAEIVPTDKTPDDIMKTLNEEGIEGFLENYNKAFEQKPDLSKGNVVTGIVQGEKVHVRVHDPELLDALTNLSPQGYQMVLEAVGKVTRMMKVLTTGINPVFSLTRNVFRDIPTAYANSKTTNNPLVFSKDLLGAIVSVTKNDELYRSYKALGGGHSSPVSSDIDLLAQSKRSILQPEKITSKNGIKTRFDQAIGALENLNNYVETAPRLAEFKRTVQDGDYDSKVKALYEANDITVNFNKFGNLTKEADAILPYLNAAVQGLNKTYRSIKDNPVQLPAKAVVAVTFPTLALYAINHDNPEYQKLSRTVKDTYFLIPKSDGTFYRVPKPRELGVLFGSDVERLLEYWRTQDSDAFKGFTDTIKTSFMPPLTRTILAPFGDVRANKDFADRPIVPGDLERLSPENQYDARTSSIAKGLGEAFNQSPKQIDYLANSYGGILADLLLPATASDNGGNAASRIGETLKRQVTADPVYSNDTMTEFYDKKTELDTAYSDFKATGESSSERNEELRKLYGKKSRDISDVRKAMKTVLNDKSLSAEEKRKWSRELQEEINRIADEVNKSN